MALIEKGLKTYKGAVIEIWDRYWLDGMMSEYAKVWDIKSHQFKTIEIGYYGSDCYNLIGIEAEIEISKEVARDIIRTLKISAQKDYCKSVIEKKQKIEKGIQAEVIRGRKIPKGTILSVFWVGERPTYTGYGTEIIAGCKDENGKKIWIKAEYLKNISPIKSPVSKERNKFIHAYINKNAGYIVMKAASEKTQVAK